MGIKAGSGKIGLVFSDEVTARRRHSFSKQHFEAARYFSEQARRLENNWEADPSVQQDIFRAHRAFITAAITSAVAGLEAFVNELYVDMPDGKKEKIGSFFGNPAKLMAEFWEEVERFRVTKKYDLALVIVGAEGFVKGAPPYQDVEALLRLRNALVHYKPEWDDEEAVHQNLRERLRDRFDPCPFHSPDSLWFPHQCLGAGCAEWAIDSVEGFLKEFCQKTGIESRLS